MPRAAKSVPVHNPHTNPTLGKEDKVSTDVDAVIGSLEGAFGSVTPVASGKFAALVAQADEVEGASLEKNKINLVGVPFVITSATFRDGIIRNKSVTNYVSLEVVIADRPTLEDALRRGRITAEQHRMFSPEESVVINDGSTGICRQIVSYLHAKGVIQVPDGPENGAAGECRYDAYRMQWVKGFDEEIETRIPCVLYVPRGLRVSEYDNPVGGSEDAVTFYLG